VAQPPGATMAVTGNEVNTHHARSKDETRERVTFSEDGACWSLFEFTMFFILFPTLGEMDARPSEPLMNIGKRIFD
jgi:hypothetical protein